MAGLETRLHVAVEPGPNPVIHGHADQLEQVLINLLRNATDVALETGGGPSAKRTVASHRARYIL